MINRAQFELSYKTAKADFVVESFSDEPTGFYEMYINGEEISLFFSNYFEGNKLEQMVFKNQKHKNHHIKMIEILEKKLRR